MAENEFKDKVVLITGAGRALGNGLAEAFAACQAILALNDLSPINLDATVARITLAGGRAKDYVFDVSKKMVVQTMVDLVLTDWGRIDILVNLAHVRPHAPLLTMDEWDWHRTLDANLTGPFLTIQRVGQVMRYQGGGAIVNVATTLDENGDQAGLAAFAASQAGLIGLTRQAARELSSARIRVNAVCLGLAVKAVSQGDFAPVVDKIFYLCSGASKEVTGQVLQV
jgi:3-oxoacyl-[acyl-carrier protein] reductase